MLLPGTSIGEDSDADESGTEEEVDDLDGWKPPTVVYSLTTIGMDIDHDGHRMRCYTAKEGRAVLLPMFADYRALHRMSWLWMAAKAEFEAKLSLMDTKLSLKEGAVSFYMDESDHWREVAKARSKRLRLSEKWSWVPWAIVVVESLAVGVIGVRAMATN